MNFFLLLYRQFCIQETAITARMPPIDEPIRFTVNWYPQSGVSPFLPGIGRIANQMLLKTERMAFMLNPVLFRLRARRATAANPTAPIIRALPPLYVIQSKTRKRNRNVARISCTKFKGIFLQEIMIDIYPLEVYNK